MNVHMMAIQMGGEVVCSQALHVIVFLQHTAGSKVPMYGVWECFQLPGCFQRCLARPPTSTFIAGYTK